MKQKMKLKCELYNDSMQNWKKYPIKKAQLVIADVPYNVGNNFYGSNPMWYKGGDNKNGESKLAGKAAFYSDYNFNLYEFFHFCSQLMKKEPKRGGIRGRSSDAPCMIVSCSFEQIPTLVSAAKKHGFIHYIPHGVQYDEDGKSIRGTGKMIFNWFNWEKDEKDIPKIHPAQKPVKVLKKLIEIFTDEGDTVIDPCAGSGSTGRACQELGRNFYGFEISKEFYKKATEEMLTYKPLPQMTFDDFLKV